MRIVERVRELGLPADQFVVAGSGILDALDLRKSGDVDFVMSHELFERLLQTPGWARRTTGEVELVYKDDAEGSTHWGTGKGTSFEEIFADSIIIEGIHFANPRFVIERKLQRGKPKDWRDIALLQSYLERQ
jgi:hypothetical protein